MSFAVDFGSAVAAREKRGAGPGAAVGRAMRGAFGGNAAKQTAIGAGLGAATAGIETGTGVLDPNVSPEGKAWHLGMSTLGGAALGNPYFRSRAFMKPRSFSRGVGGLAPQTKTAPQLRLGRVAATASAGAALPFYTNITDAGKKFSRVAQQGLSDPKTVAAIADPTGFAAGVARDAASGAAREAGKSPAAIEAARSFAGTAGNNIVGGIGGSLVGGALGGLAGHAFAADDPSLDYEARRRRERWRSILGLGGTVAGGVAAPYLLSKYAPNLIPNTVNKALPKAAGPGGAA